MHRRCTTIYEVPLRSWSRPGSGDASSGTLGCRVARPQPDLDELARAGRADQRAASRRCEIALVGKYVELHDAYMSVNEALRHGGVGERALELNVR